MQSEFGYARDPAYGSVIPNADRRETQPEDVFDRLIRLVSRLVGTRAAAISLVDEQRDRLVLKRFVGIPEPWAIRGELPLSRSFCRYVVANREPFVVADARAHAELREDPMVSELGAGSYAGFPLWSSDGRVIGTLSAWDLGPRTWTGADFQALSDIAAVAGSEIELQRNPRARQPAERQEQNRGVVGSRGGNQDDAYILLDAECRVSHLNRRAEQLLQRGREQLLGRAIWQGFPGLADTRLYHELRRSAMDRASTGFEGFWPGLATWFRVDIRPDEGGGLSVNLRDISRYRWAERELTERSRRTALCAAIDAALDQPGATQEMLRSCAMALVDHMDAVFARIWILNAEENVLELQASAGVYTILRDHHQRVPLGSGIIGTVAQRERLYLTNNVLGESWLDEKDWARREGLVAFAGVPLRFGGQLVGVAAMFARQPLTVASREALESVADRIAVTVWRRRTEAKLEEFRRARAAWVRTVAELRALERVTGAALAHLALDDLLREVLGRVRVACGAGVAAALLLTEDGSKFGVHVSRSDGGRERYVAGEPIPAGEAFTDRILAEGRAMVIDDVSTAEAERRLLGDEVRSCAGAPIAVGDRAIGVFYLGRYSPETFDDDELRLLELLADRIALAVDRSRVYEAERHAHLRADVALRERDDVVAIVSHDLRDPLNTILMCAHLLGDPSLPADRKSGQIEIIRRTAERMSHLIRDILNVTVIESGRLTIERRRVEVAALVREVLEAFQTQAAEKSLLLESEVGTDTPAAHADGERLLEVLLNLVGNAIKFTPVGGRIVIRAERAGEEVCFSVSDTGVGIAADELPHLFQRFWQSRTARRSGAGLGLTICKGIIEAHGGTIRVESTVGEGSTFLFTVPVADAAEGDGA